MGAAIGSVIGVQLDQIRAITNIIDLRHTGHGDQAPADFAGFSNKQLAEMLIRLTVNLHTEIGGN